MELTNNKSVSIQIVKDNITKYKTNPTEIQRIIFDMEEEVFNGQIELVDATNPFIHLLQLSATQTAINEQEQIANIRRIYPSLAQEEEQLYLHMSDVDFVNRFATPVESEFTIVLKAEDVLNKLVYDVNEGNYKATIPRDTTITIDDYTFTLQYPIDIRKYNNGLVEISYDANIDSPLQTLSTNIIEYQVRRDTDHVDWIYFNVLLQQFKISSTIESVQASKFFNINLELTDSFYYCRVYYQNNSTNNLWKEILTTHTDQVFDPTKPTALIKVFESQINVVIPPIYTYKGTISGNVRIDIYNTKGEVSINLSNYKVDSFILNMSPIDQQRDVNEFTNVFSNINYYCFNKNIVAGGTNSTDFDTLRSRVIENSSGDRKLPITPDQLKANVENNGFDIIKNIDVITNRIFLATRKLPRPINNKLITASNIGISTYIANLSYLKTLTNEVKDNNDRITILSNNLFINNNGILRLITKDEIESLLLNPKTYIVNDINNKKYLYNPFYYVLDNSQDEFEIRIYHLDDPIASNLSFENQNQTLKLPVNTGNFFLSKTNYGYELQITTKSGNFYKNTPDSQVNIQLAFLPPNEKELAYLNGILVGKTEDNERIYSFRIETNYDLDSDNNLIITNFNLINKDFVRIPISLNQKFNILYTTTSTNNDYIPKDINKLLGTFILPTGSVCITHETINLELGLYLKNLWSRSKSLASGFIYQTYQSDIPLLYTKDIYAVDPDTNSIFSIVEGEIVYNILHHVGDPVLDNDNNPIFKHKKGDVILGINGEPTLDEELRVDRELDILFVDGKYFFANDQAFIDYKKEIRQIIANWITENITSIQDILLEQTKIYFYPKTTLNTVKVIPNGGVEQPIESGQSFTIDLYVRNDVYSSNQIRQQIINNIINVIDTYIDNTTINITELRNLILTNLGTSINSIELYGLGGNKNYSIVKLINDHNRLSLNKKLILQQDGTFIISEDVTVNFINIEN